MRDDTERLRDIRDAIENVQKYAARGKDAFRIDEFIQTWVLHHIQILGEAAARVSDEFQEQHPEVMYIGRSFGICHADQQGVETKRRAHK